MFGAQHSRHADFPTTHWTLVQALGRLVQRGEVLGLPRLGRGRRPQGRMQGNERGEGEQGGAEACFHGRGVMGAGQLPERGESWRPGE